MAFQVLTAAAQEPLTLEEVKADRGIDFPDDDAVLSERIAAARAECEHFTRRHLMTQTLRLTLDWFPPRAIAIPFWPVQSVDQIQYVDAAGATQVLDAAKYRLVESRRPRLVAPAFGEQWPTTRGDFDAVMIDVTVGHGTRSTDLPPDLVAAMKMIIGGRHEVRDEFIVGIQVSQVPMGAYSLMRRHVFEPLAHDH